VFWVLVIGVPLLLLAGSVYAFTVVNPLIPVARAASPSPAPSTFAVTGQIEVNGNYRNTDIQNDLRCAMTGGYSDIREGAQVVVTDAASKTIALGQLSYGSWDQNDARCIFLFSVTEVPAGHRFYGIEVSRRGRLQYTAEEISRPLALTLGD
jgi:hypothetical protein